MLWKCGPRLCQEAKKEPEWVTKQCSSMVPASKFLLWDPALTSRDGLWLRSVSWTNPLLSKWLSVRVYITVTDRELEAKSLASSALSVSSFFWSLSSGRRGELCTDWAWVPLSRVLSWLAASSGMWFGSLLSGSWVICSHYLWPQEKIPTYSGHYWG